MEGFKTSLLIFYLSTAFDFTKENCDTKSAAGRYEFGQNCNYLCRCATTGEKCNQTTGECTSGCSIRWMGPACQYFNIAYRGATDTLFDNRDETCIENDSSKDVDLEGVYPFSSISVVFDSSRTPFTICVGREPSGNWDLCVRTTERTTGRVYAIFENIVQAQYIRLEMNDSSAKICEIRINAGRNLAYGQAASQSSNWSDNEGYGTAMNAVDSLGGGEAGGSDTRCIHTKDEVNPWWEVDLGSLYNILWFRIFNWRNVCCVNNLVNFTLSLSNSSGGNDLVELYRDQRSSLPTLTENPIVVSNIKILQGRYVHVTRPGTLNAALMICEIHVFGECPDNTCGFTCNEMCYCKVASYVDKLKGLCFGGCQPGWTGDGYRCDRTCAAGKFGDNCTQECGNCSINPCNHVDGKCTNDKCKAGYTGPYCMQLCAAGRYGDNCMQECGNCSISPCNHVDGKCTEDKCRTGYRGRNCKQTCATGKYGDDCVLDCGNCSIPPCNHVDGKCTDDKCKAGYRGFYCKHSCAAGTYGDNCLLDCGHCSISPCNHVDGRCTDDKCKAGYTGPYCNQSCAPGTYGSNCTFECGSCSISPCNHVDGRCTDDKCKTGYRGVYCNQPCTAGKYGHNCLLDCGNCIMPPCNHVDGTCTDDKCKAGYTGLYCKQHCNSGTYGVNCANSCGRCKDNDTCDPQTGLCTNGCEDGWNTNNNCDVKSDEEPQIPPTQSTSVAAIAGGIVASVLVVVCGIITLIFFRRRKHLCENTAYQETYPTTDEHLYNEIGNLHRSTGSGVEREEHVDTVKEEGKVYENIAFTTENVGISAYQKAILEERLRQLELQKRQLELQKQTLVTNTEDVEQQLQLTKDAIQNL